MIHFLKRLSAGSVSPVPSGPATSPPEGSLLRCHALPTPCRTPAGKMQNIALLDKLLHGGALRWGFRVSKNLYIALTSWQFLPAVSQQLRPQARTADDLRALNHLLLAVAHDLSKHGERVSVTRTPSKTLKSTHNSLSTSKRWHIQNCPAKIAQRKV